MKKTISIILILVILLSFVPNGYADGDSQSSEEISEIIDKILVEAQKLYEETKEDLVSNNGENIYIDNDLREVTTEGIKFYSGESQYTEMSFTRALGDVDYLDNNNQAIHIKFKPSSGDCICFTLIADNFVQITTDDNGELNLCVPEYGFNECLLEAGLRIEDNKWYHILMAMGNDGLLQGAVWEDGNNDLVQPFNLHIGKSFDDERFVDQAWFANLGYHNGSEITIENYAYYTFDNFHEPDNILSGEELYSMIQFEDGNQFLYVNKDYGLYTMLDNPQLLYSIGSSRFSGNNGADFIGADTVIYSEEKDCVELASKEKPAYVSVDKGMKKLDNNQNWSVLVKFQAESADNLSFDLVGDTELPIIIENDDIYFVDIEKSVKIPFSECMSNRFRIDSGSCYFMMFAIEKNSVMRCMVWEEGDKSNQAYFEYDLSASSGALSEDDFEMYISFDANGILNIYEYEVYTFDNFIDNPEIVPFEFADADTLNSCSSLAKKVLNNPQILYNDSMNRLLNGTGYSNYSGVDEKTETDGVMTFITSDNTDRLTFNYSLLDVVSAERRKNNNSQAVIFWFWTPDPQNLQFNLAGSEKICVSFDYNSNIICGIEEYSDFAKTSANNMDFPLNNGESYVALFAADDSGSIRFYLWLKNDAEKFIFCETDLSELSGGVLSSIEEDYIFEIVMGNNTTLKLWDLKILDFDGYLD